MYVSKYRQYIAIFIDLYLVHFEAQRHRIGIDVKDHVFAISCEPAYIRKEKDNLNIIDYVVFIASVI